MSEDSEFWINSWDMGAVKRYVSALFPGLKEANGEGGRGD